MKERIGTQCFGLYKEFNADFAGTIRALADIGFEVVEPLVVTIKEQGEIPKNLWSFDLLEEGFRQMKELGMTMPSAHVGAAFNEDGTFPYELVEESLPGCHRCDRRERVLLHRTHPFPWSGRGDCGRHAAQDGYREGAGCIALHDCAVQ